MKQNKFIFKKFLPVIFSATLFVLAGSSALANTDETELSDTVLKALDQSPLIRAQMEATRISGGDAARRWVPASPQLQVSDADNHSSQSFGLQVTTPFPGKIFAMHRLDQAKSEGSRAELQAKRFEYGRLILQAYLDCVSLKTLEKIRNENVNDLRDVLETLRTLYEAGRSTQAERIGAELQVRQAENDLENSKDKSIVACRYLEELTGSVPKDMISLPDDLDQKLVEALGDETADESRAQSLAKVAAATHSTIAWTLAPDFNLSVARLHYLRSEASPAGQDWTNTYGLSVSFPLFFPFNEGVEYKRARANATVDQQNAELSVKKAKADKADAGREYGRSRRRLAQIRDHDLTLAQALVDSTLASYRTGKLGFSELLYSRKTLADLKAEEVQLRASILSARSRCLKSCE